MVKIGSKRTEKEDFSLYSHKQVLPWYLGCSYLPAMFHEPQTVLLPLWGWGRHKSCESFPGSALYPSRKALIKAAHPKKTLPVCYPPCPGDKLGMGLDEKPLIVGAQTKCSILLFLSTGLEPGGSLRRAKWNHLIHRKLPPPIHCQFSVTPLV